MDSMEKMIKVNDCTNLISNTLGKLYSYGVITIEDSLKIIAEINAKQYEWMEKNFSFDDIAAFVATI